jgi:hypothetical protein
MKRNSYIIQNIKILYLHHYELQNIGLKIPMSVPLSLELLYWVLVIESKHPLRGMLAVLPL